MKKFLLVILLVVLLSSCTPRTTFEIVFTDGRENVPCEYVDYEPGFVVCIDRNLGTGKLTKYNSYPAETVLEVKKAE